MHRGNALDPLNGFYGSVFGLRYYFPYTVRFSNIQINLTTNFATSHHTNGHAQL